MIETKSQVSIQAKPKGVDFSSNLLKAKMDDSTPEHLAMIKCTPQLVVATGPDLVTLSGHLLSEHLIPTSLYSEVIDPHSSSNRVKTSRVIDSVTAKVLQKSANYYNFIEILKIEHGQYQEILEQLEKARQSSIGKHDQIFKPNILR